MAPDGDLNLLPFEALPLPDGRRLGEAYRVSYLNCGRDVLRFGAETGGVPRGSVVVADPAFNLTAASAGAPADGPPAGEEPQDSRDRTRGLRFGPLKGTRVEGERVAAPLGVKPWLRGEALKARVKRVRSPRVLHLATHGFFLPDQPRAAGEGPTPPAAEATPEALFARLSAPGVENPLLRSGLALAGVNIWLLGGQVPPEAEDGLLTAEEVTGMNLLDTELVVLSACETGLGQVHVGEGVFGLRRAFALAGARRLVTSLWKVPDEQTRDLMTDFYTRVWAGEGPAEALRMAQRAVRAAHPDPHYWAGFIFQGDPGPIRFRRVRASPRKR